MPHKKALNYSLSHLPPIKFALFVIYLTTSSQLLWLRSVEWKWMLSWEGCGSKILWPCSMCLEALRKTTIQLSLDSRSSKWNICTLLSRIIRDINCVKFVSASLFILWFKASIRVNWSRGSSGSIVSDCRLDGRASDRGFVSRRKQRIFL
jgi:hypothetical protein